MKVLFIRHGESEFNKKGYVTGVTDIGLTKKGFDEADEVAQNLKDQRIDKIICSPLLRAKQTAKPLLDQRSIIPTIWDELHEVNYGKCQGKPKELDLSSLEMIQKKICKDSETLEQLEDRAKVVLNRLNTLRVDTVVIVGHRTFTSVIFAVHQGLDESKLPKFRKSWQFENGEVKILNL